MVTVLYVYNTTRYVGPEALEGVALRHSLSL